MKNLILILYLFVGFTFVLPQQNSHVVEYEYFPNPSLYPESYLIPTVLYFEGNKSTYTFLFKKIKEQKVMIDDLEETFKAADYNLHMIQDENSIFYEEKGWLRKRLVLKDSIEHEWQLQAETKTILGFTCYSASTSFRGRNYIAWYTPEIPFSYGPWKLKGLPGLILEAYTDDDRYRFRAVSYNNSPADDQIEKWRNLYSYFDKYQKSDRGEYVKDVIDSYIRHDKSLQSSTPGVIDNFSSVHNIEEDLSYKTKKLE